MVNVFSSARPGEKEGPYATSAPNGKWGDPETFNRIRLDPPRRFALTPCDGQLSEKDLYGKAHDGWFSPVPKQSFVGTDFIQPSGSTLASKPVSLTSSLLSLIVVPCL